MNASYGSDGMNTEKFSNVKLKSKADTFISHLTEIGFILSKVIRTRCTLQQQGILINQLAKEQKKLLGLSIEKEGDIMIAVSPKNYYINTVADEIKLNGDNQKQNEIIKLKGVNQKQNIITKQNIIDCIGGNIMKCENMRLGQKDGVMSKLAQTKNGLTGVHTKASEYVDLQPPINDSAE
ncbi:MAG: hypothetical protein EZS28_031230 [Streblomastix strix]|uniref:Uncharacterized protein n=1 Tax=Streblomastix strix TaxID=222440 RepID=A0A5J4UT28_9EUKA|nr:MAG: hypothetical protein EZS28_031230 [Streblomastix strix]